MAVDFLAALTQLEVEKGIPKGYLINAVNDALLSAYKKDYGSNQNVRIDINETTGMVRVFAVKKVVENVKDANSEISLEEALMLGRKYKLNDIVEIEVTPKAYGRIAAQTAKQVVMQRIREAEREIVFEKFASREGDIVTGIVQRRDRKNVYIDLGDVEAVLPFSEQIPGEEHKFGQRIKTYVLEVKKGSKGGPTITVSRTHPGFLQRLFELEVPEIYDGTVELKSITREAGGRSKVAVASNDENVDAVGACVGQKGSRIQPIVAELNGEKIDVIQWERDSSKLVANALSPAKVLSVTLSDDGKNAQVVVPDDQLSLAIGKEGQNARLAAKLTGKKIDISSRSQIIDALTSTVERDEDETAEEENMDEE
jgi:N utilization substance protein A